MSILGSIFSSDKTKNCDWTQIHRDAASTLFAYYKTDPQKIFSGFPRLVLQKNLQLFIYNDNRNPKYLLGLQDKTLVFLQTDIELWADWRDTLLDKQISESQKIMACMDYAQYLVGCLISNVANNLAMTPLPDIN